MIPSLLMLMAAQAVGQGSLEIVNARPTYGLLGAPIKSQEGRLPGDLAAFAFDLKGLKLDEHGAAHYSLLVEVLDDKGELYYKEGPTNGTARNQFGGDLLPCHARLEIPADTPPGVYTLRVTAEDRLSKQTVKLTGSRKVLPLDFGIVRLGYFADREGKVPAPAVGVKGQTLYLNFAAVGFARDPKTKQPKVGVSMRILDENGKVTREKAHAGIVEDDIHHELKILPLQFGLTLNREGIFTIELHAHDHVSSKKTSVMLPLKVVAE
jgi:hypothetical protein